MSGVVIELGAGAARVGSARIAVAPADGGGIRVGAIAIAPLSFADRSRLVADARAAGATTGLGAAVLARAAGAGGGEQATDASILEALALHLAGARDGSGPLPGFASALVAVTCGAGWTPTATADAPADLVDRLAEAILDTVPASDDDGGWTRVVFAAGAADVPAPAQGADPATVRDALVADLLRRDAEALTRDAVALAERSARNAGTAADPAPPSRAEGTAAARSADVPPAEDAASVTRPVPRRPPAEVGAPGIRGGRDSGRPAAADRDADATPQLAAGGTGAFADFPQPIAAGPARLGVPLSSRTAVPSTAHDPSGRPATALGASAQASLTLLGGWAPSMPGAAVSHGVARSTAPGGTGAPAARPLDLDFDFDFDFERDPVSVLALSDALGAALDEECDLRGVEEA
jgi:hypothetical protein